MVLSSDLWYLKENKLKQKSAVLKCIYFFLHTQLENVKKILFMREFTIVQKV